MEIQDLNLLVDYIANTDDKEEIKRMIVKYGDVRCEGVIKKAWDKALRFYNTVRKIQKKRIQNEILNYDEENSCISLREFTKYYCGVEDELYLFMRHGRPEYRDVCASIISTMSNRLGDLRVDRRLLFANDKEGI